MKKLRSKKGFTLMEMLIVVAIIGILVAIAVPVFSTQLNTAKVQVDAANLRSAESMAVADYMLNTRTGAATYCFNYTEETHTLEIAYGTAPALAATGSVRGEASGNTGNTIKVVVTDGDVTSATWAAP
ncbi:hypothetical protein SDC9_105152 [bioreactor metagenome]|uniref:Prepilin-type N-terminal cleavage/methylation domain-containing protein n=1 Tax=bioreactor metagenome TaxID=1076179 RepID=A0A645B186_9ZZZZ